MKAATFAVVWNTSGRTGLDSTGDLALSTVALRLREMGWTNGGAFSVEFRKKSRRGVKRDSTRLHSTEVWSITNTHTRSLFGWVSVYEAPFLTASCAGRRP